MSSSKSENLHPSSKAECHPMVNPNEKRKACAHFFLQRMLLKKSFPHSSEI